jgi:uncharacterized protein (DUF1501 family)
MTISSISRRTFLQGCSTAIAAMAGSRLTNVAFASPTLAAQYAGDTLITIFLRGGWDALNVFPPLEGADRGFYESKRVAIKIPTTGTNAGLTLANATFGTARLGMHSAFAPLKELYDAQHAAVVCATGLTSDTRSHFDAMQFMELGTPGSKSNTQGWITRALGEAGSEGLINTLSVGSSQPISLAGRTDTATLQSVNSFDIVDWGGRWYRPWQMTALRTMYGGTDWLSRAGMATLDTIDALDAANPGSYTPKAGVTYPNNGFGNQLKMLAQTIKMNIGLKAATLDLGGWDSHDGQGNGGGGYLFGLLDTLARGLNALYNDLSGSSAADNYIGKVSVVVMSEFGRRLEENASEGTDHGHGSALIVMGGGINGGKVYGRWPGLASAQLFDRADLAITTDYRQVLSELVAKRMHNLQLGRVFPGLSAYSPLGLAQGDDSGATLSNSGGGSSLPRKAYMPGLVR